MKKGKYKRKNGQFVKKENRQIYPDTVIRKAKAASKIAMKRIHASQYAPDETPKSISPCLSFLSFSAIISVLKLRKLTITGMKNQKDP